MQLPYKIPVSLDVDEENGDVDDDEDDDTTN